MKDERAMAARSTIIHDDKKADALFILENILCMLSEMRRNSEKETVMKTAVTVRTRLVL